MRRFLLAIVAITLTTACTNSHSTNDTATPTSSTTETTSLTDAVAEALTERDSAEESDTTESTIRPPVKKACAKLTAIEIDYEEYAADLWQVYAIKEVDGGWTERDTLADGFPNEAVAKAWLNACAKVAAGIG